MGKVNEKNARAMPDPAFGMVPAGASEWGIRRADVPGPAGVLDRSGPDGVARRRWPLAELSIDAVREAWGPGFYRVQWYGVRDGRPAMLGNGAPFRLHADPGAAAAAAPAAEAAAPRPVAASAPLIDFGAAGPGVTDFVRLWSLVQGDADRRVEQMRVFLESNASAGGGGDLSPVLDGLDALTERIEALEKQLAEAIRIVAGVAAGGAAPGGAAGSAELGNVRAVVEGVADLLQKFRATDSGSDSAGG